MNSKEIAEMISRMTEEQKEYFFSHLMAVIGK